MNAAAKVIHQSNVFTGHWFAIRFSQAQIQCLILIGFVLISAFATVYVTNAYRFALNDLTALERQTYDLNIESGQLLIEQASLANPSRVEALASKKFNMSMPTKQATLILNAK